MPAIVGILTFISKKKFMHSWVDHENRFMTSGMMWVSTAGYVRADRGSKINFKIENNCSIV